MKKRISLRTLMILVALCATCLVPYRLVRQYRADRVQYQSLIAHHKDMEDTRKLMAASAEAAEVSEIVMRDAVQAITGRTAQPEDSSPSGSVGWFRKTVADYILKEAEARAPIEHWKATHLWF